MIRAALVVVVLAGCATPFSRGLTAPEYADARAKVVDAITSNAEAVEVIRRHLEEDGNVWGVLGALAAAVTVVLGTPIAAGRLVAKAQNGNGAPKGAPRK